MNLQLAWPWLLLALPLPLLAWKLLPPAPRNPGFLRGPLFSYSSDVSVAAEPRPRWRLWLAIPIWILLVLACCRPQWVGDPIQLPVSGRDLMLAVDLSGSMKMEDMEIAGRQLDRLSAVKSVAGDFIARREGDRLGLILFGDRAYLQTPLTFDRQTVKTLLDEAVHGLAGEKTAMGDAIALAVKRLRESHENNRVLILLTDGANTAGSIQPLKAASLAAQEGIRIYTVGVGADPQVVEGFFGQRMLAGGDLDEKTLEAIAKETGGRYFRARDTSDLQNIYRLLDQIEPTAEEAESFRPVDEWYWAPLALALMLSFALMATHLRLRWKKTAEAVNA